MLRRDGDVFLLGTAMAEPLLYLNAESESAGDKRQTVPDGGKQGGSNPKAPRNSSQMRSPVIFLF
jgi:hypothetical protein